ncbi:hypothetical protein Ahy_A03g014585 [Arachis hypogaea]|uniref:Uncharacterized protein n=1 Tax=Arachis hypogaea TaxID=3818 RepID=A0A445DY39_ARAHY|nr:hypothetical protein Ahy_A03g014585 [Arachis hypogaea]
MLSFQSTLFRRTILRSDFFKSKALQLEEGGTIHVIYRDACFVLELLQDDREFLDIIKEVSLWDTRSYVRRLFIILLIFNNISRLEYV